MGRTPTLLLFVRLLAVCRMIPARNGVLFEIRICHIHCYVRCDGKWVDLGFTNLLSCNAQTDSLKLFMSLHMSLFIKYMFYLLQSNNFIYWASRLSKFKLYVFYCKTVYFITALHCRTSCSRREPRQRRHDLINFIIKLSLIQVQWFHVGPFSWTPASHWASLLSQSI